MKLNQELVKKLADGDIIYYHTGTPEQWRQIMTSAFPDDEEDIRPECKYYFRGYSGVWFAFETLEGTPTLQSLPTYTTEQFFETEI